MPTYELPELTMEDLPEFARHPKILERCKVDLSFRGRVLNAKRRSEIDKALSIIVYADSSDPGFF